MGASLTLASPILADLSYTDAQIVILGEVHDNPLHHARQAEIVAELQPKALVLEMLPPVVAAQANQVSSPDLATLSAFLDWEARGWPDFAMYYPIFTASDAVWVGAALPPADVRRSVTEGAVSVFGADAARFGLDQPLHADEQADRETFQDDAHCNAMPADFLPGMVDAQRLRDAAFSRTALDALETHGAPVVVIAGWGHAHRNWAMPRYLEAAAPEVSVFTYGMVEEGYDSGRVWEFDEVYVTAPTPRDDPCAAFKKQG